MNANEFITHKKEQLKKNPFMFTKDIGEKGKHRWRIASRTLKVAEDLDKKVFTFERMEYEGYLEETGKKHFENKIPQIQYRIGYFIVGRNGRWTWGQYTPMISAQDLSNLLLLARKEGTLLD